MDDLPIHDIHISGPTLAALLHRFTSSSGDLHGLLFGHVTFSTPSSLSDDPITTTTTTAAIVPTSPSHLTATITSFISLPSHFPLPFDPPPHHPSATLIGWFSGRRKTTLRPSLKESTTTQSLSSLTSLGFKPENSQNTPLDISLPPSLFLLLTTPFYEQLIHTHEYKAFQYSILTDSFEPKSLNVVNIGPSFRSNYEAFTANSPFPLMPFELMGLSSMNEDGGSDSLKDQKALDGCAQGFEIGRLGKLMGSDASNYSAGLEELYDKMLAKLEGLTRLVEKSSNEVLELENHNMKMRRKIAGLE
ncbi:hypothetical protein LIER_31206 [Lithospermum erythrorhizon]|uniref:Uncharacterized protein n=1 Tax=Lithospermum erythrorhizon TaxID=34254 RepID=A0AAV3RTY3_LITER